MSSTSLFKWMGLGQQSGKTTTDDTYDEGERYFGLENFGNTCYSNSVVQALYFCKPFRHCVLNYPQVNTSQLFAQQTPQTNPPNLSQNSYFPPTTLTSTPSSTNIRSSAISTSSSKDTIFHAKAGSRINNVNSSTTPAEKDQISANLAPGMEDTLFSALKDLFWKISTNKKKTGVLAPINFINKVKKENELFRSSMHQDAHEFLNYVLNTIADAVQNYQQKMSEESSNQSEKGSSKCDSIHSKGSTTGTESTSNPKSTWVHQLFEGIFSNETKCLTCETVTSRDECFMDLSIDVEMNSSITSCLRQFSASETLCHKNKYFCDVCSGLQEAERRMKIKKLPNILALHLKRFKYQEQLQKYIKLTYRVVFPFELRLFNTSDDTEDADRMYELWAFVVHIGSGPHHGHYVTIVKNNGQWLMFDDEIVTQIQEEDIQKYFSDLPGSGSGYVLFYQSVDFSVDINNMCNPQSTQNPNVADSLFTNGRPSGVSTPHTITTSSSTSKIDTNDLNPPEPTKKEELNLPEIPTPENTPSPPLPQPVEEKKTNRWTLGRKKKEKK
ncbi:hypothetical protein BDB01DRAFT_720441 [Pilobolus umbonatus]|nr:hypothetical protein BDB01DRAFT_720441 [Pilobolus umbonatus]